MISIQLDESMIPPELLAWPEMVRQLIREWAEETRNEIIRQAMGELETSFDDYVAGLQPVQFIMGDTGMPNGTVAVISLIGELPNMIEEGWPGGDMKPALLSGRNAKTAKDGTRYNTVPFRQMNPGATGRYGTPMGQQYVGLLGRTAAEQLGKRVYAAAKSLQPGGRLPAGMAPILKAHHKTDLFDGLTKQSKRYSRATQNQYTTFRRVSDKSDPRAFIHPGIEPHRFFAKAADYAEDVAPMIFDAATEDL